VNYIDCEVLQWVRRLGLVVECFLQLYTVEVLVYKVTILRWSYCNNLNITKFIV